MTTPTPLQHTTHHDDCGCLTARYEARIAELEAELAEAREHAEAWESEADSANTLGQSWMAHANDLRGALEHYAKVDACEVEEPCLHSKCEFPACVASYRRAKVAVAALASTPAASLAAYRARVLEEAERLAAALAKSDCSAGYVATRIRALAATPAASLTAHDAEVLERAIAEITNRCVRQVGESSLIPGYNRCMDDVERAIERIRALAAQEVTK